MKRTAIKNLILLFLCIFSLNVTAQSARKLYKAGEEFVENGKYADAVEQYTNALKIDPEYTQAYIARARALIQMEKYEQALEDCTRAMVFSPKDQGIYTMAGKIQFILGKYMESIDYLNTATSLKKRDHDPYQYKARSLMALEKYERALEVIDTALIIDRNNYYDNYLKGQILEKLRDYSQAEVYYRKATNNKDRFVDPYLALARLKLEQKLMDEAIEFCNTTLSLDDRNTEAHYIRSHVYVEMLDFPSAINDISKNIIIDPENSRWYMVRGEYYQKFNQHQYAINDFNKLIQLAPDDPDAYFKRARSFEEILDYASAIKDYEKIASLSEYDVKARQLLDEARKRLFELNRESDPPLITLIEPVPARNKCIRIRGDKEEVVIKGEIKEASELATFRINETDIHTERTRDGYTFLASIPVSQKDKISFTVKDVYDNLQEVTYAIEWTETNNPEVKLIAPYASDNGEIYLSSDDSRLYVEGQITDESPIRSIMVEGLNASYRVNEMNPTFSATIDILNKNKFTVVAEDVYGNRMEREFTFNREGAMISENNPMGKTWVIFIENSQYQTFASLDGPTKDVSLMKMALAKYDIHNIITKKNMTKEEMEKFFSIELRDLVRSNHVNSLLIWYAGHGKFINETGYWIPIDARRDDEYTYFNINFLRAAMQSYRQHLTHLLVVTDACESGPTFYQAMRSTPVPRSCDDETATKFKSSQVFSSAGYELAVDNSQFTRTFANTLANNPNACLPIENVVAQVTVAVAQNNQQRPKFGKIAGLEDENGTFFFILKE